MSSDQSRSTAGHPLYQSHSSAESPPPQYSQPDLVYTGQQGPSHGRRPSHDGSTRHHVRYNSSAASDVDQTYFLSQSPSSTGSTMDRTTISAMGDGKAGLIRSKLSTRFSQKQADAYRENAKHVDHANKSRKIGGRVIERPPHLKPGAAKPRAKPHQEMRGLEQAASVWRWTGGGAAPQAWGKLAKDPELWNPTGDTVIYFSQQRPEPSFRVQSSVLEETESEFFITLLREGYMGKQSFKSSSDSVSSPQAHHFGSLQPRHGQSQGSIDETSSLAKKHRPRFLGGSKKANGSDGQPTPPLSAEATIEKETAVLYEIYLPTPPEATRMEILRHHLTTRNVLALLLNKSLVGLNFYQALIDLQTRLQVYLPLDMDCASIIIDYLETNKLVDVRNDPARAAGLLGWSEESAVQWHEGWREAFIHCAGMYRRLSNLPELRDVSQVSRALLEHSHLELEVRIHDAEDRLASFNFADVWPVQSTQPPPARVSFERFRRFLRQFYENAHRTWPPRTAQTNGSSWLTRDLAQQMQKDFGALYDYLVDRDVTWTEGKEGSREKARIVSKTNRAMFRPDSDNLRMTDLFNGFDGRNHCEHIPHPYPLVPASMPVHSTSKQSFFGSKKIKGLDKKTAFAYSEASNVLVLQSGFSSNSLLEAFLKFEKTDQLGEVDPQDARKGRWILLYCILQILAGMSIDTPKIWYKDDVSYFLSARLKGTPPWDNSFDPVFQPASRKHSHCWTIPQTWANDHTTVSWTGLRNHKQIVIASDGIGDGTGRVAAASPDTLSASTDDEGPDPYESDGKIESDLSSIKVRSQEGKLKEWPIQGLSPPPRHGTAYTNPAEW